MVGIGASGSGPSAACHHGACVYTLCMALCSATQLEPYGTFDTYLPRSSKAFRSREVLWQDEMQEQEFYFCAAYLAFQKEKLADLDVCQIARDRQRRIEGRKRVRQEHKTYADTVRAHAESHKWKKPKNSVIKENDAKQKERKDATQRMANSRGRRAAGDDDDVFHGTDILDWGSQPSSQPSHQPVYVTVRLMVKRIMFE